MNLQKTYVVIKMTNSRKDFTESWIRIHDLYEKNKEKLNAEQYNNFYSYNVPVTEHGHGAVINEINNALETMNKFDVSTFSANCGICLWIKDCNENDTIEYQYLALMLQRWPNLIAYIYSDNVERIQSVCKKVASFFSFFIQRENRRNRIWLQREKRGELFTGMIESELYFESYKVLPILEFGEDKNSSTDKKKEWGTDLEQWTRTVGELLEECEDLEKIRKLESYREIVTKLGRGKKAKNKEDIGCWKRKKEELNELYKKSFNNRFLLRCIDYFVSVVGSSRMNYMGERREVFWSEDIQNFFSNMPIISFYILCVQLHFMKEKDVDFENDIRLLLVNAEAITEGVIQLLENLYHSSDKGGLLSIRVHEKRDKGNDYLKEKHKAIYMNSMADFFFEFRVLDYSTQSILESFRNKQRKKGIYVPENMGIGTFFEHDEQVQFWDSYNKISENLVHHYGLQIFSNVISNNGGYFCVTSSSQTEFNLDLEQYCSHKALATNSRIHIPGTECVVLIPLQKEAIQINPSVDADINYSFDFGKKYKVKEITVIEDQLVIGAKKRSGLKGQELKEWRISELKRKILQQLEIKENEEGEEEKNEKVALFYADKWLWSDIEVYCKAIMLCLIEKKPTKEKGFYLIIRNCTPNVFVSITRMFAIFYGKDELSNYMEHAQIYLSGIDPSEEFLIAGKEISALFTIARKMTLVRGIQPQCLYSIEYVLNKFRKKISATTQEIENLALIPFDMLQLPQAKYTLFEQAVKRVLESDIQKYSFGCKLSDTHMRIGSKLHMNEFYEAELLFHNNYYVSRFTLLLLRDLSVALKKGCPIMFVGYETYSELLLYELVKALASEGHDSSYMVYEERETGKFRYYNSSEYIKDKENLIYVVIVPINSTMTTHSKIRAALRGEIRKVTAKHDVKIELNYALILVYPEKEKERDNNLVEHYYTFLDNNILKAEYLPTGENLIRYFVTANAVWSDPLECKKCFPQSSMLEERPLIETNRVSIIPVQMLGVLESNIVSEVVEGDEQKEEKKLEQKRNLERVKRLAESLIYRHIIRKENHFLYYFELEKYFMQNREDIIQWLKEKRKCQEEKKGIIYDIIVAPLHHSNAGFVTEVNSHLYGNAALVLNFEVEKEYRDNVKTKYSNIIGLYKKLLDIGKEAELRFHFVDDNIITGSTYLRAKSLFTSLFPCEQNGLVRVTVFKDVIVMLNRMSRSSIMNCVNNYKDYHSYVSLNISSMRNHEDACTQCKVVENARKLREQASTNQMYEFWNEKMYWHRIIEAERYEEALEEEKLIKSQSYRITRDERQRRAGRRMLCTHMFNEKMEEKGHLKNNTAEVKQIMLDLLERKNEDIITEKEDIEWIISCIKVFSRPFVCFRKSSREAIFQIMLEVLEFMTETLPVFNAKLKNNKFRKKGDIKNLCCIIRDVKLSERQDDKIYILLLTVMQRLSDLNSNYLIRKENMKKLFAVVECLNISEKKREGFKQRYLSMLKRITCLSSDENKCIYLDYLLLYGEEYVCKSKEAEKISNGIQEEFSLLQNSKGKIWGHGLLSAKDFQRIAFLENTRVLYDGICDLANEIEVETTESNIWGQIKEKYYYDNFKRMLKYYRIIKVVDGQEILEGEKIIGALVKLYYILNKKDDREKKADVEQFYNDFLECAEIITGAKSANLLFSYDAEEETKRKVYKKSKGTEIGIEDAEYEKMSFIYDTYSIDNQKDTKVFIKYKNYVGNDYLVKDKKPMNTVYLELNFERTMKEIELMILLKYILMFRNLIIKRLEKDFSNNLMQKWSAELNFKRHMKLERATDHTAKDELAGDFELLVGGMDGCEIVYQKALFNLVINSYIARMNVQLLADDLPEGENVEYSFEFLYGCKLQALINRLQIIEQGFEIIDENGKLEFSKAVREAKIRMYRGERRCERLSIRRLSVVIVELIHSAVKYSDDRKIYIYRENEYLVVKNSFNDDRSIDKICREIKDSYSRKRDGISLAVIKELIDTFYELNESEGVKIMAEEEGVEGRKRARKYYYVKLPILSE